MGTMAIRNHCWAKKPMKSKKDAEEVASRMTKKYFVQFKAYRCKFCGKFHIGRVHRRRKGM